MLWAAQKDRLGQICLHWYCNRRGVTWGLLPQSTATPNAENCASEEREAEFSKFYTAFYGEYGTLIVCVGERNYVLVNIFSFYIFVTFTID